MAIYPGATYKPITASKGRKRLTLHNRVNLHVAVSEAASLHPVFDRSGQVDSHFYVRRDGSCEQYVDTDWQAFADFDGNDATISIETQGGTVNADSEPWTAAQLETLAAIYAWAVAAHGVAQKLATSSKLGDESKGLSWHRLGCDGNFPAAPDIRAGRTQRGGGMRYSKARGKICPGAGKIVQIPSILDRALAILGGAQAGPPAAIVPPPVKPLPAVPRPTTPTRLNPSGRALLDVDGFLGGATIRELQHALGTTVDGVISTGPTGSAMVAALQRKLVAAGHSVGRSGVDGFGLVPNTTGKTRATDTVRALQRYLGTPVDGVLDSPSNAVRALQVRLNTGKF